MKNILAALLIIAVFPAVAFAKKNNSVNFYEATIYHFTTPAQEGLITGYLEKALLPALHKLGMKAGIFKPVANDTAADKTIYVVVDHGSWNHIIETRKKLRSDQSLTASGREFLGSPFNAPAFTRKEIILMEAFHKSPVMQMPALKSPKAEHIYEWRSYESATEDLFLNKVKMFNEGNEIGIFSRLNFNAIFYATVLSGPRMPNLIYMTSFENMDERNAHWKLFGSDPEWKTLSGLPEYQDNVSKADIILMKALPISDY